MKYKFLTVLGFMATLATTAHAGGIHCDDDPMCLPCVPGVACHNSIQANSDLKSQQSNSDFLDINGDEAKDLFDSMTGEDVSERIVYGSGLRSIVIREAPADDGQMLTCSKMHHGVGLKFGTADYRCTLTKLIRSKFMNTASITRGCHNSHDGWVCPGAR